MNIRGTSQNSTITNDLIKLTISGIGNNVIIKSHVKNLYQGFSINNFEDISLYIKLVEIITDTGYFFDDKKSIFFSSYDYMKNNIIYFQNINNFLSLSINVSTKREIYRRSYIKLQTIISNVGGELFILLRLLFIFGCSGGGE